MSQLHIIVPCYNPPHGWAQTLAERFGKLKVLLNDPAIRLTVVNDGSVNGISQEDIGFLKANVPTFQWIAYDENKGKGYALRKGIAAAEGDYFIYTDIDFPYTLDSMKAIYKALQDGTDVAVGVRENEYYADVPLQREIISKVLKKLIKYLMRIPVTDTQCGLKGFNKKGKTIFLETTINRFLFDMEYVQKSFNTPGIIVKPVNVNPRPDIVFSKMNYKVLLGEAFNFAKLANPLKK